MLVANIIALMLSVDYVECRYAECRYNEHRGATKNEQVKMFSLERY
jgi:hypothetical protein